MLAAGRAPIPENPDLCSPTTYLGRDSTRRRRGELRLTKYLVALLAVCLLSPLTNGQPRQPIPGKLPIKRVVLFKNGVGYFEHVGAVHGNESVTIGFTSGQLNDVLKSLTVLDLNGGRIVGVAYGIATPLDRQLVDLRLPVGEKTTLAEFLGALRGTRLEVRSGPSIVTGRLLSIERKTRISGGTTLEVDYLSLISDGGESPLSFQVERG